MCFPACPQQNLHPTKSAIVYASQELKFLMGTEDNITDSPESMDAENYISVLSDRFKNAMRSLNTILLDLK